MAETWLAQVLIALGLTPGEAGIAASGYKQAYDNWQAGLTGEVRRGGVVEGTQEGSAGNDKTK